MSLRDHGLSITLFLLFAGSIVGQAIAGWHVFNEEQRQHNEATVSVTEYVRSGHFGEATFENWESEFLQMACYVLLTAFLYQRGSAESKRPGVLEPSDLDPRQSPNKDEAPCPVRKGGLVLTLYEHSLSLAFAALFLFSFVMHGWTGMRAHNLQQLAHGQETTTFLGYFTTSQFWFESFENWQSEFLSLVAMVVLSIFLRQRGSPESKPVDAPVWETGG